MSEADPQRRLTAPRHYKESHMTALNFAFTKMVWQTLRSRSAFIRKHLDFRG